MRFEKVAEHLFLLIFPFFSISISSWQEQVLSQDSWLQFLLSDHNHHNHHHREDVFSYLYKPVIIIIQGLQDVRESWFIRNSAKATGHAEWPAIRLAPHK